MATATKTKSIETFKARREKLRKAHNDRCEAVRKGEMDWKESLRQYHANQAEHIILLREVEEAGLGKHILNKTITFQSGKGYEDNHDLGDALEKQFPQGKDDSELGQGFFYINEAYVPEVLEWLKDKVCQTSMSDSEMRRKIEELHEKSKARPCLQAGNTVGDGMLK